jgi:hypothetical protein
MKVFVCVFSISHFFFFFFFFTKMEGSKNNVVLVLGHVSSNSKSLISDVIGSDSNVWTVENKYFSARLEFLFVECDGSSASSLPEAPHAVVFVFDPNSRHESAARPSFWDPFLSVAENASIRVLVSHSCSQDDQLSEVRFEAWKNWCAEKELELLEADMESSPSSREAGAKRLLDDCDEDEEPRGRGKERLLEALSTNMWPIMHKKELKKETEKLAEPKKVEKVAAAVVVDDGGAASAHPHRPPAGAAFDPLSLLGGEEDDVEGPDQFEKALTAAREMREHALALPDDERREFASKMTLYLMSLMGGLEDEEEGEGGDDLKKA